MDKYLAVSGTLGADSALQLEPGFLTETPTFEQWPTDQIDWKDQVWVELRDMKGDVLIRYALPVMPACALPEDAEKQEGMPPLTISGQIPFPDGTAVIRYLRFEKLLLERPVSDSMPMVSFTWDPKTTPLKGIQKLTWQAKHATGEKLFHILQFSIDQGASWRTLTLPMEGDSADIDFDQLPGGDLMLGLLTSDGVNTTLTTSQLFTLAARPCVATIISPLSDDKLLSGEPIPLIGSGYYLEEGKFENSWFRWNSDIDGELGFGSITEAILSVGQHTITLRAGRSGREGTASVMVSVTK
jgi:hypothetical protein